jgi:hypothetical protein
MVVSDPEVVRAGDLNASPDGLLAFPLLPQSDALKAFLSQDPVDDLSRDGACLNHGLACEHVDDLRSGSSPVFSAEVAGSLDGGFWKAVADPKVLATTG